MISPQADRIPTGRRGNGQWARGKGQWARAEREEWRRLESLRRAKREGRYGAQAVEPAGPPEARAEGSALWARRGAKRAGRGSGGDGGGALGSGSRRRAEDGT